MCVCCFVFIVTTNYYDDKKQTNCVGRLSAREKNTIKMDGHRQQYSEAHICVSGGAKMYRVYHRITHIYLSCAADNNRNVVRRCVQLCSLFTMRIRSH